MMQVHALASRRARTTVAVRAAIYARVSSDQQAERHTIDSQVEALLARAAADGHEVAAELRFLDDGQSGASLIRPALERLRDLAARGGHRRRLRACARPPGPLLRAPSGAARGVRARRRRGGVPQPADR